MTVDDLPWLSETLPPFEIENLRAQAERLAAEGPGESFELQCRNLARNREAGMTIGMGTDSGVSVAWTTHTEMRDMAGCGLTPMEAIAAATRVNAEILGLDDLGTVAAGKPRVVRGARREPAGRHREHAADRRRLFARRGGGPRGAACEVHGRLEVDLEHAPRHVLKTIEGIQSMDIQVAGLVVNAGGMPPGGDTRRSLRGSYRLHGGTISFVRA